MLVELSFFLTRAPFPLRNLMIPCSPLLLLSSHRQPTYLPPLSPHFLSSTNNNHNQAYTIRAASAFAAYSTLRALLSGVFPLFAKHMYQELGVHAAGTILAAVATVWLVTPWVLWRWGGRLRGERGLRG